MAAPDLKFAIETPREWDGLGRAVEVCGWCFDASGSDLKGIRVKVGETAFKARRKQTRHGVAQLFPEFENAKKSGFTAEITLPKGRSEITIEARIADGSWHAIEKQEVRVPRWRFPWQKKPAARAEDNYQKWVERYDTPDLASLPKFSATPKLSIVLPVYDPPEKLLRECLDSVIAQTYPHWELCIADDASPAPHVRKVLEEYQAKLSDKIRICFREENGHICESSNSALELATGDFMVLLDHDDLLPPHALHYVAAEIDAHPDAVLIYSDEDKIDEAGVRQDPYFKPDWDPDLLLGQNCISHLGVYKIDAVHAAGAFRLGTHGSQDWDLALRVTERCRPEQIRHIDRILYHWRLTAGSTAVGHEEKPYTVTAGEAAAAEALARRGQTGCRLKVQPSNNFLRILHPLPEPAPMVEIIIPTKNRVGLVRRCVESIRSLTDYPTYKITVVDNGSDDPETLQFLENADLNVIRDDGSFNFSRLNNVAAKASTADVLVLLNNDTEIIEPGWLHEMVVHAVRPEIGAVGAKLLYPTGLVQHIGVVLGYQGAAGHLLRGKPDDTRFGGDFTRMVRSCSAVTAACLAVRRESYLAVSGMDEETFGVAYNDVDFCLKLSRNGFRNIITPFAVVVHDESVSRKDDEQTPDQKARANREIEALQERWGDVLRRDPYYNRNLTLEDEDGSFAAPRHPSYD